MEPICFQRGRVKLQVQLRYMATIKAKGHKADALLRLQLFKKTINAPKRPSARQPDFLCSAHSVN
jgi:hypothetical protein